MMTLTERVWRTIGDGCKVKNLEKKNEGGKVRSMGQIISYSRAYVASSV